MPAPGEFRTTHDFLQRFQKNQGEGTEYIEYRDWYVFANGARCMVDTPLWYPAPDHPEENRQARIFYLKGKIASLGDYEERKLELQNAVRTMLEGKVPSANAPIDEERIAALKKQGKALKQARAQLWELTRPEREQANADAEIDREYSEFLADHGSEMQKLMGGLP